MIGAVLKKFRCRRIECQDDVLGCCRSSAEGVVGDDRKPGGTIGDDVGVDSVGQTARRLAADAVAEELLGSRALDHEDILGRAPDAAGLNYYVGLLNSGTPRPLIVSAIVFSTENLASNVNGYYEHFLSRGVDAAGENYWVGQLQHGARDEVIVALIIGSDEYFALV